MVAPTLTPRGWPGDYPASDSDLSTSVKRDIITVPVVAVAYGTTPSTDNTLDVPLPTGKKFVVESVTTLAKGITTTDEGSGDSYTPSIDYRVDGTANPTLPVTASTSLGARVYYTESTYSAAHTAISIGIVCFKGYWTE